MKAVLRKLSILCLVLALSGAVWAACPKSDAGAKCNDKKACENKDKECKKDQKACENKDKGCAGDKQACKDKECKKDQKACENKDKGCTGDKKACDKAA